MNLFDKGELHAAATRLLGKPRAEIERKSVWEICSAVGVFHLMGELEEYEHDWQQADLQVVKDAVARVWDSTDNAIRVVLSNE